VRHEIAACDVLIHKTVRPRRGHYRYLAHANDPLRPRRRILQNPAPPRALLFQRLPPSRRQPLSAPKRNSGRGCNNRVMELFHETRHLSNPVLYGDTNRVPTCSLSPRPLKTLLKTCPGRARSTAMAAAVGAINAEEWPISISERMLRLPRAPPDHRSAAQRCNPSPAHARAAELDLDLGPEFDHAVGRDVEEVHGAGGAARHPGEDVLAPHRHAGLAARDHGFAAEEI